MYADDALNELLNSLVETREAISDFTEKWHEWQRLSFCGITYYPEHDPRQYSDILKKKRSHSKKPNTKGFVVRPKMYARQRR